jgi:hypothetical protein
MSTNRQFVAVRFNPWDQRTYTYHWDGEPLLVDDRVVVETKKGRATVTVTQVDCPVPSFETKPILGRSDELVPEQPAHEPAPPTF